MKEKRKNLCEYLLANKKEEEKTAILYDGQTYSYKDVYRQSCLYGKYIRERVSPGNKMIIHIADQPRSIFLFLGAIKVGVHPILLNHNQNINNIMDILDENNVQLIICDYAQTKDARFIHIDNIRIEGEIEEDEFYNNTDRIFSIFSSGSSGQPKLISHSYEDVLACIRSSGENIIHVETDDIFYSQSSLSFAYGIVSGLFLPFAYGASTILNRKGDIFEVVNTVKLKKPTLFFAVPVIYKNFIRMNKMNVINLNSVRMFISAGELMPFDIIQEWEKMFKRTILQGIGSTELLYLYISNTLQENRCGSLGKVLPGYFAEIRDENGQKINQPDIIGELYVRGDSLSSDILLYDNIYNEHGTIWLKTGDLASRDSEGFYWYCGRCVDNFKLNGLWVDSIKIAEIIKQYDKIRDAIVIGKLSTNDTTKIIAYIQVNENIENRDIKKIKTMISKSIGREFIPDRFYIVDEFPRNINGKIERKKLAMKIDFKEMF